MRTLSKLLSVPVIAGLMGAVAMTAAVPASARDYDNDGRYWSGEHHNYHHWRGDRDEDWGPNVSFGFYGSPYYDSDYYGGYYGSPSYGCDTDSWYSNSDDCYGGYYGGYYGDWDD